MAQLLSVCRDDTRSSTILARGRAAPSVSVATLTGSLKRRGPALPGLRNSAPSRVATTGVCE
jgi:hypothetical protein